MLLPPVHVRKRLRLISSSITGVNTSLTSGGQHHNNGFFLGRMLTGMQCRAAAGAPAATLAIPPLPSAVNGWSKVSVNSDTE